ncbi:MAG: OsmC family protein [Gemmatimonadaceae bacterium]
MQDPVGSSSAEEGALGASLASSGDLPPDRAAESWVTATLASPSYATTLSARGHLFAADEPATVGGLDSAPTPYELLLGALCACTAMTMRMYAMRKGWALDRVTVRVRPVHSHSVDCVKCENESVGVGTLERDVEIDGTLTPEQRVRLLYIADRCPIKQSMERGIHVVSASATGTDTTF